MERLKSILRFKKKIWIPSGLVLLFLAGFVIWGSNHYSKEHLIKEYVAAYSKSGNAFENIKKYLVWSDNDQRITNDDVKYADFTQLDAAAAQQLTQELKTATSDADSYVKRVGSKFLIFPDYKIAWKPLSLTIKTNLNQVDVLLNKKKVAISDSEDFSVNLDRLPVADYTASISGSYNDKHLELSKTYDGSSNTLDLTVTFKNFTVTSNLTDGDLYFDETCIGTLSDGSYQVSDYPLTDSAQVFVKKTYADGDLMSNKQALSTIADEATVALNADNLLDESTAGQVLVSAFDQLMTYVTTGQDSSTVSSVFENGANNEFYKGLKESVKTKMQTDTRTAGQLTIPSLLLTGMTQVGKESYQITFSATYDFYYDKSTDSDNKTYGDIVQQLSGQLTLKKSGNSYVIANSGQKSITVLSEGNNLQADAVFPENLIGTWTVKQGDDTTSMTFATDGTVTKTVKTKNNKTSTSKATVTQLEEKGAGLYHYIYTDDSDTGAFHTGGIGGVGVKYTYGIKINASSIQIVVWQAGTDQEFDYSQPLTGATLTKE